MSDETSTSEFPRSPTSMEGTDFAWAVEVKVADNAEPFEIGGQLITHKWKKLELEGDDLPLSIPVKRSYHGIHERRGLLEYSAAQALRWWLHAYYDAGTKRHDLALETRLIEYKLTFTNTCTAVRAHQTLEGKDHFQPLPDWVITAQTQKAGEQL